LVVPRTEIITLRMSPETKRLIQQAATLKGVSMTTMIEQEVTKVAQRIVDNPPTPSGACPSFFKALCLEAGRGGHNSYRVAGYELTRHVGVLVEETDIDDMIALAEAGDDDGVIGWFEAHLPKCMALVPQRRRGQFVLGVYSFDDDYGIAE